MQLEVKGNIAISYDKFAHTDILKEWHWGTAATSIKETRTNMHTCILPLCMPFKFFLIIFIYFLNISSQDVLPESWLRKLAAVHTDRSGFCGTMDAYRGAPLLFQVPWSIGSSLLGLCGEPGGTRDRAAQSSIQVNASANPAHTEQPCGVQPQKSWEKVPPSIDQSFLWSGGLQYTS